MGRKSINIIAIFILAGFITSCAPSGSDGDTARPEIVSRTPAAGAADVVKNTNVSITFNKSVLNVNLSNIYIEKLGSFGRLNAVIQYDDASKTATLDPETDFDSDAIYLVTVLSGITSRAGVPLRSVSRTFTTSELNDTDPPLRISHSPSVPVDVPAATEISITFNELLLLATVSELSFYIKKTSTGEKIPAVVTYNEAAKKVSIAPVNILSDWTNYTVYYTDAVTDLAGNRASEYSWTFMTNDPTDPSIVSKFPAHSATGISTSSNVEVTFSESIKSYTIHNNSANFKLEKTSGLPGVISATVVYNDTTRTAILYPSSVLENNSDYKVTISGVKDLANNTLVGEPIVWTFQTSAVADITKPTAGTFNPASGAVGAPTDTSVSAVFSEAVSGVSSSSFTLTRVYDNQTVTGSVTYNSGTRIGTFTLLNTLEDGTVYRVNLTSAIKDTSNNTLDPVTWTFTTADNTAPAVISKNPLNGAGGVASNINISSVFSENVTGVSVSSFTVYNETTASSVSGEVTYTPAAKTAVFNPDTDLAFNCLYTVTLTNAIKDITGNSLNTQSWSFETGSEPDSTPPAIINPTYPDYFTQMNNVPRTAIISIYFSEPVTGIGSGNIQLKKGNQNGIAVSGLVTYDPVAKMASFIPGNYLDNSEVYTVVVKGAAGISDAAGNIISSDIYWSFTTVADTTAPTVVNRSPEAGTPDIPGNAVSVAVVFSEQVLNVDNATFELYKDFGDLAKISCNVTYIYNAATNTPSAVLTPLADITATGTYRVKLKNTITDISAARNPLQPLEWIFIVTALDLTAPSAVVRVPNTGGTWIDKKVTVIFSEPVKGVSAASFYVKDDANQTIPAVVTYSEGLLTAELVVSGALPYEKTYRAYLTSSIMDKANNQFTAINWPFSTAADIVAPTVTSVYPLDGTNAYPVSGLIKAIFSEDIQGYSGASFYLFPSATANITYDPVTYTLTLTPVSNLIGNTAYTVYVKTAIKDKAATPNNMTSDYTWQFTTQAVPDTTPPTVVAASRTPAPGSTGFSQTGNILVSFNENVVNATSKITLKQGTTAIPATVAYNSTTFTATLNPDDDLTQSTVYTVVVADGPTGIQDVAGNALAAHANNTWTFTTQADTTDPSIISRYPLPNATGVPLKPAMTVTFSEPVNNVTNSTFYITGSGVGAFYVVYDEATRTATLTPGDNLQNATVYTINLTTGITDRAGRALPTTWWTFTTNSLPVITNIAVSTDGSSFTTTADGATGVNNGITHIRLTFNRNMNTAKQWMNIVEGAGVPAPVSAGQWSWSSPNPTVVTYTLTGRCKGGTVYRAQLFGWGGTFEDTEGNTVSRTSYVGDGIFDFTTAADSTAPAVVSSIPALGTTPAAGAINVGQDTPYIVLRFNETMQAQGTAEIQRNGSGSWLPLSAGVWFEGRRAVMLAIPVDATNGRTMQAVSQYNVRLGNTTVFRDFAGNNLPVTTLYFSTGSTTGSATVTGTADSFESYTDPNFSVFRNITSDSSNCNWTRSSFEKAGNGTVLSIPNLVYLVKGSQWEWDFGSYADIQLISSANFTTPGTYIMTFSMFHERLYNQIDSLQVWVSTDGTTYSQVRAGALMGILRYDWSFANDSPVWQTHYVNLSQFAGTGSVWVRLRAISAGERGGNVIIDNVGVTKY